MKIAFLGIGRMGRELAKHLVTDGHDVTVWNRTYAATTELRALGASATLDAAEAVDRGEVVVTALFGPDAVREVVVDCELPLRTDALWLDITTVAPADAAAFQAWADQHHIAFVHAPVIGSLAPARARMLGSLLGGKTADVARAADIAVWADPAKIKTYDSAAKAAAAKLIANLTVALGMEAVVEALRLGHSNGMTTEDVLATLDLTVLAGIAALKGPTIRSRSFADTQFSADLLAKDLQLMFRSSAHPLPAAAVVYEALEAAVRAGHGNDDFSVIAAGDSA